MFKRTDKPSKVIKDLYYTIITVNNKRSLAVNYKDKQVLCVPRYQKTRQSIKEIESFIGMYECQIKLAYDGKQYDKDLVNELRLKLYDIFTKNNA